jgi:hypothetical protein
MTTEWYSVDRTIIVSYKQHQRQMKMKKLIPLYNQFVLCTDMNLT